MEMVKKGENMLNTLLNGFDLTKIVGNSLYFILALILLDIVTGLLASAVEKKLNSKINFQGMIKKVGELVALVFITLVDAYFKAGGQITKLGVSMLVVYEALSVIENFSRIGINLSFLTKFFDPSKVGSISTDSPTPKDEISSKNEPIVTQDDYNRSLK
jgi:toxin secretion/phage lysis holin